MKNKIIFLFTLISPCFFLGAETYKITGERQFKFVAKIKPGTSFESQTTVFDGTVNWKESSISGKITVKLETLNSGIGLRDSHMREKNIHTAKYPDAIFEPTKIEGDTKLTVGQKKQFKVIGKMTFHGKTKELSSDVRATLLVDGSILIESRLKLPLSEFSVEAPSLAFVKVEEEVTIFLNFTLKK